MMQRNTGRILLAIFIGLMLLAGSFSGGVLVGWLIPGQTANQIVPNQNIPIVTPTEKSAVDVLFEPFWDTWQYIHDEFVNQPVDDNKLMQGAINGMLASLGDKHTGYMTPDQYEQATTSLDGSYEGIGAYVDVSTKYLTIISAMPGTPAADAGLQSGDEVIKVNGVDVSGEDPNVVLKSVKGPAGTDVNLTIFRPDTSETLEVTITRQKIDVKSVLGEIISDDIAYVQITTFGETTTAELKATLKTLLQQNPKGLILDLRYNSGGYLNTSIEVISQFIASGTVLIEQQGNGEEIKYSALPGGLATDIPLVVLVNEGSASASEITAGAIQDLGRGILVGVTTYGKGSVQDWIALKNEQGAVRITVARWLTPSHRQINELGLTPDVVVPMTEEDYLAKRDPQLEKAIEILHQSE